jgi:hypothetical protein
MGGNSRIACTGLWSDMVSSGVDEKATIWVVVDGMGGGIGSSVVCGEKRCVGSVHEAYRIRSVQPGTRFL